MWNAVTAVTSTLTSLVGFGGEAAPEEAVKPQPDEQQADTPVMTPTRGSLMVDTDVEEAESELQRDVDETGPAEVLSPSMPELMSPTTEPGEALGEPAEEEEEDVEEDEEEEEPEEAEEHEEDAEAEARDEQAQEPEPQPQPQPAPAPVAAPAPTPAPAPVEPRTTVGQSASDAAAIVGRGSVAARRASFNSGNNAAALAPQPREKKASKWTVRDVTREDHSHLAPAARAGAARRSSTSASAEDMSAAQRWVSEVLLEDFGTMSFAEWLRDGGALCRLANTLEPGSIPTYNRSSKLVYKSIENISAFLRVIKAMGVRDEEAFDPLDLAEEKDLGLVVRTMFALARVVQSRDGYDGPTLVPQVALSASRVH